KVLARIHHGGTSKHVVWSDDDRSLVVSNRVFATSAPVELIDVASGTVTPLLSVTRNVTGLEVRGTMAMIAGGDGQLWLWDLQKRTGRSLLAIKSRISSAQLARDGRTIVFTAADGVVRIVDVGTGALISLPLDAVEVAFTADGSAIFVADKRGVLATVDLRTQHRAEIGRQNGHILALAVASDGALVATGSEDHMVYLWNLRDHSMRAFAGDAGSIFTLHFSPDNRQLASGGSDTTVRVWQLETGVARVLRGHAASVQSLAYSADGRYLVSTAEDRTARVWETSELFPDVALSGHQNRVVAIAYSPDGRHLATASDDLTVRLWSLPDGRIEAVHQAGQGVSALTFSPDGARLAIGGDRAIVVWDVRSGAELSRRELLPETCVWSLRFSADGHRLAAATDVGVIYLISDGELQLLRGAQGTIRVLAFSPDGRTLVSGGDDHEVSAWDVASGGTRHTLQRHADNVTGLAFTPDGKTLISSSWDGTLRLRDLSSGAERSLRAPGKLSRLALSRSGRFVAAAATDGTAALWDLVSGARRLLQGHTAAVLSVEFSPDERLLLSSGYDKSARVWDVATGEPVQIARSDGYILASAFSSIGAGYATGGEDRFVHLWPARAAHATSPSGIRQRLDQLTTSALSGTPAILKTQ
ncbi:MAG TPA: WD40 repeat domain-containing protein, partial [Polyangia bacterium]